MGSAHHSSVYGCTCLGYRNRGVCTHQEACRILARRSDQAIEAKHPAPCVSYRELFPDEEPEARVTIARPCAIRGCPVEAGTDSARCPHHARQQRAAVAA